MSLSGSSAILVTPSVIVSGVTVCPSAVTLPVTAGLTLSAEVEGTGSPPQGVTWSSSNPGIASITSAGVVTANAVGTATISARSTFDTAWTGTGTVTVIALPVSTFSVAPTTVPGGLYSSADLLQRCRDMAQLPEDDESMDAAAWFRLLTDAQMEYYPKMASHIPQALLSDPVLLTSDDGGQTFGFGLDTDLRPITPLAVQVFRRLQDAYEPDGGGVYGLAQGRDFIHLSDRIQLRSTGYRPSFPDGAPWVRFIAPPGIIDASHEPVLLPIAARPLLVLAAVEKWATQGDLRDASTWVGRAAKYWAGDGVSDIGLLGALKLSYPPRPGGRGRRYMVLPRGYAGGGWG